MNRKAAWSDTCERGKPTALDREAPMSFATRLVPLIAFFAAPFCAAAQTPDYEVGPSLVCGLVSPSSSELGIRFDRSSRREIRRGSGSSTSAGQSTK